MPKSNKESQTTNIAVMSEQIKNIREGLGRIENMVSKLFNRMEDNYVTKTEWEPYKRIIQLVVTLIVTAIITALLALVIRQR